MSFPLYQIICLIRDSCFTRDTHHILFLFIIRLAGYRTTSSIVLIFFDFINWFIPKRIAKLSEIALTFLVNDFQ